MNEKAAPPTITPADIALFRKKVEAEVTQRVRAGQWSGAVGAHTEYQHRPIDWIVEKLEVPRETLVWSLSPEYADHQWDGSKDPLVQIAETLANWEDCGVESGTGPGKTFFAACLTYWFIAAFEDSIVSTVAPKEDQLLRHIWKEMGALWPKFHRWFPQAELLPGTGVMRMKPAGKDRETWAASAFVCGVGATEDVATKAQGLHAEHMLIITEETPGIHPAIMEAIEQTRTDDHNLHLALGNPDHQQDPLHLFCFDPAGRPRPGVHHVRISVLDHPNIVTGRRVVPGAIGAKRLARRTDRLGVGSRLYNSRVRGISPSEAEDALVRREWCEAAAARYNDPAFRQGPLALGVDPSNSEKGDPAGIARWQGACCTEVVAKKCPDASLLGVEIVNEIRDPKNPIDPRYVGVDAVGVGASTVNKMKELGVRARWIFSGIRTVPGLDQDILWTETETDLEGRMKPSGPKVIEAERFDCLRSQILWRGREDLRLGRVAMPYDVELFNDLCTATYTTKDGKICVETKEKIIDRLKRSTNKGDAWNYGNWVRRRAPVRQEAIPDPRTLRNQDFGLERFMARHRKREEAESRRMKRFMAQRERAERAQKRERRIP